MLPFASVVQLLIWLFGNTPYRSVSRHEGLLCGANSVLIFLKFFRLALPLDHQQGQYRFDRCVHERGVGQCHVRFR